jgi:nicotinate phosphoribosyltransferase
MLKGSAARRRCAVKLSDNPTKAMGPRAQVERYKRVFEVGVQTAQPVLV